MALLNFEQPEVIFITENIRLKKTDRSDWEKALVWYQNPKVLYYSEGITDKTYDMDVINRMYTYLSDIGELYFIEILENELWRAIGDVTLSDQDMPIVIGDEKYWGKGIGKRVLDALVERAKALGLTRLYVKAIYLYNDRSQNLFKSVGFKEVSSNNIEKSYELLLI